MHDDNRPVKQVFVSGVSSEFQSSRLLVRDDLLTGSIHPVLQDHFAPEASKTVEQMLRQKIEPCAAVICLIGHAFGAHPVDRPDRSYTQMEFHIARELGKPVFRFLATDAFPPDKPSGDSDDQRRLQQAFRTALRETNECFSEFSNQVELRSLVDQIVPKIHEMSDSAAVAGQDARAPWKQNPFAVSKLPRTGDNLIGRAKELATLVC